MKGKKIADYINVDTINLDLKSKNKNAVIKELYEGIKNKDTVKNEELGLSDIYAREAIGSTGIGKSVALPHAKTKAVDELTVTFGISKNGIRVWFSWWRRCKNIFYVPMSWRKYTGIPDSFSKNFKMD